MPLLNTQKHLRTLKKLPFCYLCGEPFKEGDDRNDDHIPPEACFAKQDRNFPLKLPTHTRCNSSQQLTDEKIAQIIGLKQRRIPRSAHRRLKVDAVSVGGNVALAVTNIDIDTAVWRWVRGFHAALYSVPLPVEAKYTIRTPFPAMKRTAAGLQAQPLLRQHSLFVEEIKINRAKDNLDRIQTNNQRLTYECVWVQSDSGPWMCVFAIDLYAWKDLGDVHNFVGRGCAGSYILPDGVAPLCATRGVQTPIVIPNSEPLDPFGG